MARLHGFEVDDDEIPNCVLPEGNLLHYIYVLAEVSLLCSVLMVLTASMVVARQLGKCRGCTPRVYGAAAREKDRSLRHPLYDDEDRGSDGCDSDDERLADSDDDGAPVIGRPPVA